MLLEKGAKVNALGGFFENALQAAVVAGTWDSEAIVLTLLERGADMNVQGGYYGCALDAATYTLKERMVSLLNTWNVR
jgi:hypothetical protein